MKPLLLNCQILSVTFFHFDLLNLLSVDWTALHCILTSDCPGGPDIRPLDEFVCLLVFLVLYDCSVAVLHFCNWGGSRGGIGCDRGGTKSFNPLTPTVAIWVNPVLDRGLSRHL